MELIRSSYLKVEEIVNNCFADNYTDFTIRVDEDVEIKNIRLNIVTEFQQEILITIFPSTVKETPFIALDKGKYIPANKLSIEIGINPSEDKHMDEMIMLKNVLPGMILGITK